METANNIGEPARTPRRFRKRYLLIPLLCIPLLCAVAVVRIFFIGSDTSALRECFMGANPGHWQKKIAVHAGFFTFGAVRLVCHFVPLPPEPRAAVDTMRGADVGVYRLLGAETAVNRAAILANADRVMDSRGWVRVVGVVSKDALVAVYVPRDSVSLQSLGCCVAVLNHRDLVVVSAHGNVEPLLALAATKFDKI
jgi:hypothetical protein